MAKNKKEKRPKARLPKGLRDVGPTEARATFAMISAIRDVYETYGFEPLESPAFEYTDALGKFLPDTDRPNEGVFSFQDEDDQWLSLRYDMTAPLARYVAENKQFIPTPFRRYAFGPVWRNEKPGPGRFRQFMQFDADTVGTASVAADAEMCMLAADTLEKLGLNRGDYLVRVNNRKVLDGIMQGIGINPESEDYDAQRRLIILRALDKLDRLGAQGVADLLGDGRKDDSGDFTKGAGLAPAQIDKLLKFVTAGETATTTADIIKQIAPLVQSSDTGCEGLRELEDISNLLEPAGYTRERVMIDPSVVRGLDYYTGPVFEAELTFDVKNEDGESVRFGSIGGGGRYDDLVARFTGQPVPATGFSIGVSRLQSALTYLGHSKGATTLGPVVVLVMDRDAMPDYQAMVQKLRAAGIRSEMYVGTAGMKAQMKYADKRNAPCVIIQGGDEKSRGEVQIKDLIEGAKAAATIADNKEWKSTRPAQFAAKEDNLVQQVRDVLARHANS